MVEDMERQGFTFNKQFKNSLKVTGKSASQIRAKAQKLKAINKTALAQKVTAYTADDGRKYTGKSAYKRGRLQETRKARKANKEKISALQNVDDMIAGAVDVVYNHGTQEDVSDLKMNIVKAWDAYKDSHSYSDMDLDTLNKIHDRLIPLQNHSQSRDEYDAQHQIVMYWITGKPVDPDNISNEEEMENVT